MGVFTYPIEIGESLRGPFIALDAVVDSGAFYSQAPTSVLRDLGVEVIDKMTFLTADGVRSQADIGQIVLRIDGRTRQSICVFGDEAVPVLLGAYALEGFMLGIEPVNERLVPIEGVMLHRRPATTERADER